MKKSLFFILASVALIASCAKEIPAPEEQNEPEAVKETVVFTAGFAETKTAFGTLADGKYPNLWAAGDKIVVNGIESAAVEEASVGTSSATFTIEGAAAPYCIAYPAAAFSDYANASAKVALPAEQAWIEGTYDPAAMIMLAKTSETAFTFNPAMCVIRITPTNAMGGVKSIALKSLDGKKLSGAFTTNFETIAAADGASDVVTMKADGTIQVGKDWFIAVPAADYQTSGFLVTITDANGSANVLPLAPSKAYEAGHVYTLSLDAFPAEVAVTGHDDIVAFCNSGRYDYNKLVLDGNNETISDSEMADLKLAIKDVKDLTIKNIKGWTMLEQLMPGGDFTITPTGSLRIINCPNLNNLNGLKWITKINGDLVFENCPNLPWNWGAGNCANQITEITGDFTIDNAATALTGASCLASLTKVGGNFTVKNCNASYWDLNGMPLTEIGGDLTLVDDSLVNSFLGFAGLTKIGGNLLVKGTAIADFTQVQTWINDKVLKGKAECWNGSNKVSFNPAGAIVITGHDDIVSFSTSTSRQDFDVLVLDGNNETISDSEMAGLKLAIKDVKDLTFKNIKGWTMVEQIIIGGDFTVTPTGSLRFINCPNLSNINGLKWMTKVNGDLVFEDCPNVIWNWGSGTCLNQVTEIAGDFTIDNAANALTGSTCLASLKKVGGDFTITNCSVSFWNLEGMPLEEIGGNFTYTGNALVNSFIGFEGLKNIGGNLLVKGTAITDFAQVQTWISKKVLKGTAECWNGNTKVNF